MKGEHLEKVNRKNFDFSQNGKREPHNINQTLNHNDLYFKILKEKETPTKHQVSEKILQIGKNMT